MGRRHAETRQLYYLVSWMYQFRTALNSHVILYRSDQLESMMPNMDMQEFEILLPLEVVEVNILNKRIIITVLIPVSNPFLRNFVEIHRI